MADQSNIAPPRIGSGMGYFICGGPLLALGMFAALAATGGGGSSAIGVATFCLPISGGLIAVGFLVSLFGKLEQRLIDLQTSLQQPAILSAAAPPKDYRDNPNFGKF